MRLFPLLPLALASALALTACQSKKEDNYVDTPVEQLYNQATDQLLAERHLEAARLFDEVERQHPYSVWAAKAQLMAAYAHFQRDKHDDALIALDRFIQLHPSSRDIAYAYYLKALCYYERIADVGRDQQMTQNALAALTEVVKRFPDSTYARDARLKIDLTNDHLAGKEMAIGRYYQRQTQYVAAVNRYRKVIEEYQTTSHTPEALHRLVESYLALGVKEEAQAAGAVLGHNFPGSDWYLDSYALLAGVDLRPKDDAGSWITRAFNLKLF